MIEAESNGVNRKPRVVLPAREPLLLRRGDNAAVNNQCRCAVVVIRGDSKDPHVGVQKIV